MSDAQYNHATIKQLAKSIGRPLASLYALSDWHDPFVADMPGRRAAAEWFANIWRELRFEPSVHHDRKIHYILVPQPKPIIGPNGKPYENTERWFIRLGTAVRDARYLGLIPPNAVIDRRNPEPEIFYADPNDSDPLIYCGDGGVLNSEISVAGPRFYRPRLALAKPTLSQAYHIEIWCEKSTMSSDVLLPLGQRYGVNIVTANGEISATACEALVGRAQASERPVRILYVSDFDSGGQSMPVAAARKIEFFATRSDDVLDIQVRPVVLTYDQCIQYRLPRAPIKETERRRANFEARFGEGATELDALEVIRPGELRRILVREIERYYDSTLNRRIERVANKATHDLDAISHEVHQRHAEEIAELDAEQAEIAAEAQAMQDHIALREAAFARRAQPIFDAMKEEMEAEAPDVDDYDWPEPEDSDEDPDPLFDSTRSYVEQVERYREHQGKEADPMVWTQRRFNGPAKCAARASRQSVPMRRRAE